ncbi:hypothetical protein D3C80_699370 [compost metagenome]
MGVAGLDLVTELDVRQLGAADDPLLRLHRQRVPGGHVVQVLLHQHIAAATEGRVFITDQGELGYLATDRVLGAIDEADDAAHVEIAKALHFIHHLDRIAQGRHQLGGQFKAQVHLVGADVQEDVAGGGRCAAPFYAKLTERVQGRWPRPAEQLVPGTGGKTAHARQVARRHALADRAGQAGDIGAPFAHGVQRVTVGRQGGDHENRAAGDRAAHRLGFRNIVVHGCLHTDQSQQTSRSTAPMA